MRARHNSVFIHDPRTISGTLDRNQRARLMAYAEALERRSKAPGRQNGCLGYVGLRLLKCLIWSFLGPRGCFPSYDRLQEATGLCRQSIRNAVKRLEASGILRVVRRIVRVQVGGIVMTRQASNVYGFDLPGPSLRDGEHPPITRQLKGLGSEKSAGPALQELKRGDLGELASVMMRRLRAEQPDWRAAARKMASKRR